LQKNRGLKFLCGVAEVRVETTSTSATGAMEGGRVLRLPINHFEGSYICAPETLDRLRAEDQVVFRYVDNPNGSVDDIAGVCNEARNVVGLMPHPERASHELLGSTDGLGVLRSILAASVPTH
ncbi:MAG TPA: phosphoribosylformylglycinamidine synthase subunit PurQ, partial [Acidimicrobiales bacterium]